MNKLKFLTTAIISTLFFSTITTNAMKNRNFSAHNLKNINSSSKIPKLKQIKRTATYENHNKKINLNKNKTEIIPNKNTINIFIEKNNNEIKNLNNINTKKDISNIIDDSNKEKSQNKIKISENMKNKIKILENLFKEKNLKKKKEKKEIEEFIKTLKILNNNLIHISDYVCISSKEHYPSEGVFYLPNDIEEQKFMAWNSKNILSEIINIAIDRYIKNGDIINNYDSIFKSYMSNIENIKNSKEEEKTKNEYIKNEYIKYINKMKQEMKKIIDAILYDLRKNNSYQSVTNFLEFCDDENNYFNYIDGYIENIKKNRQEYEKFIEKSKIMKKLKEKIPKILKREAKYFISEIYKSQLQLQDPFKEVKKIDIDLKDVSGYIRGFKNILNNYKYCPIYTDKDANIKKIHKKEIETLEDLKTALKSLEEKNRILVNKNDIDITPEEMLDYYDEIIKFTDKIRSYMYIYTEINTNENYMLNIQSNHSLYLNKIIKNRLENNNIYFPKEAFE